MFVSPTIILSSAIRQNSFNNTSEHENCGTLPRSEGHIAFVYKDNAASGIERISIEDLLVRIATRGTRRLVTGQRSDSDRLSAGARTLWTGRTGRTGRTHWTRWTGRTGFALGWRLALAARDQKKGS
jgi:hypothetical protein